VTLLSRIGNLLARSSGTKDPAKWLVTVLGGSETAARIRVDEEAAMRFAAVFAAVKIIAETVATLPFKVYRRSRDGSRNEDPMHPAHRILNSYANEEMLSLAVREAMTAHLCLWGNAYAEIVTDGVGRVAGIWPIDPWRVVLEHDKDRTLWYRIHNAGNEDVYLPPAQVLHIPGFGTNGWTGRSPIYQLREAIGVGLAAEQTSATFFGNDATPSIVLVHPNQLSADAAKRIKEQWQKKQGGRNRAGVAVTEEGMEVKQLTLPMTDAELIATRKFQLEEVARAFRVPLHMLGDLDRATFSNIEHQGIEFVRYCLRPYLDRWEAAVARLFGAQSRHYAEHAVEGLLRGDSQARVAHYQAMQGMGVYTINEIRQLENLPPVGPDGDKRLISQQLQPLADVDKPPDPPVMAETDGDADTEGEEDQDDATVEACYLSMMDAARRVCTMETNGVGRYWARNDQDAAVKTQQWFADHASTIEDMMRAPTAAYAAAAKLGKDMASKLTDAVQRYTQGRSNAWAAGDMAPDPRALAAFVADAVGDMQ
jgi:HK97 family phage portal protein